MSEHEHEHNHKHEHHHDHEHEHEHEHEENPKESIIKISITAALSLAAFLLTSCLDLPAWGVLLLWLAPYLLISYETYLEAFENIRHGEVFDENFLMCVAATGAMVLGDYKEAVLVMLLFQIGELFEGYAVGKSRRSIEQMMDIRPDMARVVRGEQTEQVKPEEVAIGETIEIRPGERIPLDGVVLAGDSTVDTSALTGESLPAAAAPGDDVLSGCVNLSGLLRVQVTKAFGQSTVSKKKQKAKPLFAVSLKFTRPVWSPLPCCWPLCRGSSHAILPNGSRAPARFWSFPAHAAWSFPCR